MKKLLLSLLFAMAILAAPGFAYLNITSNHVTLGSQSNLSSNVTMLNLTFNLTDNTTVNITSINFTFSSTTSGLSGNQTNLSVCVYNSSRNLTNSLGCSAAWVENAINLPIGYNISNEAGATFIVDYEIFYNSTYPMDIGINISTNTNIALDNASIFINSTFPIASSHTTVRVVQASANITPRYVDTNVTNQTFRYFAYSTTGDLFSKINITIPSGFTLVNVTSYTIIRFDDSPADYGSCIDSCSFTGNNIIITNSSGIKNITIYFNATTSATPQNSTAFTSTIDGTNVIGINTSISGSINTTILNLISVNNVSTSKNSAFVNGTDYWEFSLSVNTSATVNGKIQFKMNDWNSPSKGKNMSVFDGTKYYAFLWDDTAFENATNKINVTNNYNITDGVLLNATGGTKYVLRLRMIIPAMIQSSATPIASDWWTTYSMLFRAIP